MNRPGSLLNITLQILSAGYSRGTDGWTDGLYLEPGFDLDLI